MDHTYTSSSDKIDAVRKFLNKLNKHKILIIIGKSDNILQSIAEYKDFYADMKEVYQSICKIYKVVMIPISICIIMQNLNDYIFQVMLKCIIHIFYI